MRANKQSLGRRMALRYVSLGALISLSACGHSPDQLTLRESPARSTDKLNIVYEKAYADLFLQQHRGVGPFVGPLFEQLFKTTVSDLLSHNGLVGSGEIDLSALRGRLEGITLVLRPSGVEYWQPGTPTHIRLESVLLGPTGLSLGELRYMSFRALLNVGFSRTLELEVERSIATMTLAALNALQERAVIHLKYPRAQTMAGSTNPFFGRVR